MMCFGTARNWNTWWRASAFSTVAWSSGSDGSRSEICRLCLRLLEPSPAVVETDTYWACPTFWRTVASSSEVSTLSMTISMEAPLGTLPGIGRLHYHMSVSAARHRYQAATERCGDHRRPARSRVE